MYVCIYMYVSTCKYVCVHVCVHARVAVKPGVVEKLVLFGFDLLEKV